MSPGLLQQNGIHSKRLPAELGSRGQKDGTTASPANGLPPSFEEDVLDQPWTSQERQHTRGFPRRTPTDGKLVPGGLLQVT